LLRHFPKLHAPDESKPVIPDEEQDD